MRLPPGLVAFAASLALFGTSVTSFDARVVDLGAMRICAGDVPYRDFWTMYSPGAFYVVAGLFAAFGKHLVLSNALGVVTAAAGVAAFHRFATVVLDARRATLPTLLFAVAYFSTGYHRGFQSYPPAILCICLAATEIARFAADGVRRRIVVAGVLLGAAAIFKHDIAGYACIAAAIVLVTAGSPAGVSRWKTAALLAACAAVVALPPYAALWRVAGDDMVRDLVVFPLTDFPRARNQGFPPIVPRLAGLGGADSVRAVFDWAKFYAPIVVAAASLVTLRRRRAAFTVTGRAGLLLVVVAFPLFVHAAQVQLNTHLVTLAGFGALLGVAALTATHADRALGRLVAGLAFAWCVVLAGETCWTRWKSLREGTEFVGLPRLAGIRATHRDAEWMRGLAAGIAAAAPADAPLLMVAGRNDVLVYAHGAPYWLADRPFVTRHEELHPAITDTEPVQRRMLEDIAKGPMPVVVVEHRFPAGDLDGIKAQFLGWGLPIGATALDAWVAGHYRAGDLFGMYEVMRPR